MNETGGKISDSGISPSERQARQKERVRTRSFRFCSMIHFKQYAVA
jgi:hypothetical protein